MKSMDRLIKIRQQQRDEAAARLERARKRLAVLLTSRDALALECKKRIHSAVGTQQLRITDLERMDIARTGANKATQKGKKTVDEAKDGAKKCFRKLRQVEIWHEKIVDREKTVVRKKERRVLDEIAQRAVGKVLLTVFLFIVDISTLGCTKEKVEFVPIDAGIDTRPAPAPAPKIICPDKQFSPEELALLRKLRRRREQLQSSEDAVKRETEEAELLKAKAEEVLNRALKTQERILGKSLGSKDGLNGEAKVVIVPPTQDAGIQDALPPDIQPAVDARVSLSEVLKNMNTRKAAAMLAEMNPEIAADALRNFPPEQASRLLAQVPADAAALIAEQLRARKIQQKPKEIVKETEKKETEEKTDAAKSDTVKKEDKGK